MRTYRLLTPAYRDLADILAYLNEHSSGAASNFLEALDTRLNLLANAPYSGRTREEYDHADVLYLPFPPYLIAYYPTPAPIRIVAIVRGSRDLKPLFADRLGQP